MLNVTDILFFTNPGKNRSDNHKNNEIRENLIANMNNINSDFFNDKIYGELWKDTREKHHISISGLCESPFSYYNIERTGGMSKNYDFIVTYYDENKKIIKIVKLEFKFGFKDISKIVQFLEIYDKDAANKYNLCDISYIEYFYYNFLDKYIVLEDGLFKPEISEYIKNVYDIKYKHPFYRELYNRRNNKIQEKREVVNKSIKSYLETYSHTFNFDKILEKIKESNKDKIFLLWDCKNFYTKKLDVENMFISGIKKISNLYFDISVENFEYDIRVRINWGNNNGICTPRWKLSLIKK
jgi:hypothetical protein